MNSLWVIFMIYQKIFHHTKAKGGENANSRIRWERDRENYDIYGEESLGIFVELNTPVSLEAPHLRHTHVTWYFETDFELSYTEFAFKRYQIGLFFKEIINHLF